MDVVVRVWQKEHCAHTHTKAAIKEVSVLTGDAVSHDENAVVKAVRIAEDLPRV